MPEDRQDDQNDGATDQDKDKNEQDDQRNADSGGGNEPDDQDSGEPAGDAKEDKAKELQDKYDALRRDNLAKAKELEKLKTANKKANADKDAAKERDEAVAERDKLQSVLDTKFLAWSIATNSQYEWNDPDDVRVFIKSEEIKIDLENGEVEGLDLALKRIAKEKPYLLKKTKNDEDTHQGPSGQGGQGRGTRMSADEAEVKRLGQKFKIPGFGSQAVRPV